MSTTLKLKHPVKIGSDEVTELTLRRPKGKDLRKLPAQADTDDILNMAAALANVPPSTIDELDGEDVIAVLGVVESFLPGSRPTGRKR